MIPNKQKPDFLLLGRLLLLWYRSNSRDLPWRISVDPYSVWISEIILQQTQVSQGLGYYQRFMARFPTVQLLASAAEDEVLLYWKGLGYYSRALNLHKAAGQITDDLNGVFPTTYAELLKLKGVGKYTAAAIASICFNEKIPAVDGNFYRVLSRLFADDFDVSDSHAFYYYSQLALKMMPAEAPGDFNQAVMDLGADVCRPRNPNCSMCPLSKHCIAYQTGTVHVFPVKTKKAKVQDMALDYFFVTYNNHFLIRQRGGDSIWKKLYEFPAFIPDEWAAYRQDTAIIPHKLTHKNMLISIHFICLETEDQLLSFAENNHFTITDYGQSRGKSFPKPLEKYMDEHFNNLSLFLQNV